MAEASFLRKKAARRSDDRVAEDIAKEKMARLIKNARGSLLRQKGQWVSWHSIRPPYRDREEYEESVWEALVAMDEIEVQEEQWGSKTRRRLRISDDTD